MIFLTWSLALLLLLLGTWATLRRLKWIPSKKNQIFPAVSILKPLKGADLGLEENLKSFFLLDYPNYEIIFSVADANDPAIPIVRGLQKQFPGISKLLLGAVGQGANPKVNNLIRPYAEAAHDILLISDSNVKVKTDYLSKLVPLLEKDVGVVTAVVAGVEPSGVGGYLESVYLNTFYARGMNLAFLFGKPCVVGKSMMFRKSNAEKFGGLATTADFIAEDYVIGEKMREMGLKIVLMNDPIDQFIGNHSFSDFWRRHIRWGRIRKSQAPLPFLLEPFVTPLFSSLAFAKVAESFDLFSFSGAFLAQLILYFLCDMWIAFRMGARLNAKFFAAWALREILSMPMWLMVASGNSVNWRGTKLSLKFGGRIDGGENSCRMQDHSFGDRPRARTKWRAIISSATGGYGNSKAILPEA